MEKYYNQVAELCLEAGNCTAIFMIRPYTSHLFAEIAEQIEGIEFTEEDVDHAINTCGLILDIMSHEHERDREMITRLGKIFDEWKGSFMFARKMQINKN